MSADPKAPAVAALDTSAVPLPARAVTANPPTHQARVADRDLLVQLAKATRWWARQHTRRVSSSHTGGGVIEALEAAVAARVAPDAHALALPSGTAALSASLAAAGVGAGDRVGVPAVDWTASGAVLRALGAVPVQLPVHPDTGILDPARLDPSHAGPRWPQGSRLAAIIAVHLHGLTCDVPALCRACPDVPVVEDAARAWAACYPDGGPVGSAAAACAFSFGSAKVPSAGELGCLVTRDLGVYHAAVQRTQHPTRQLLAGMPEPRHDQVMTRVAPAAALLGGYVLHEHASAIPALRRSAARAAAALRAAGMTVLTDPSLHAPGTVAVRAGRDDVRSVLAGAGVAVTAIDSAGVTVHPDYPPQLARALRVGELTVATCA
jgi:DegT/DnrJ/EryC1/StrS aminotransferase family